ncbi:SAND domain and SAND domain-like-containing protein [Aphelenchoides bicaudatus]|nr:SAND domain and SAND domain-like-containing protein [Aphelenchoides bicaudatus]
MNERLVPPHNPEEMLIGGNADSQPEDHFSSASSIPQSPNSTPPLPIMPTLPLSHSNVHQNTIVHSSNEQRAEQDSSEVPTETPSDAPIHDVRCGVLNAKLHMQRFTCPGIHRRCIEYDGKMITPRQFTIQAEKDKQKDWKGSIRFGRYNLRTMMETKALDFYQHETNCSLKCQSRNYIKNRKSETMESFNMLDSMVPSAESRSSNEHNDENNDYHQRKRSVLDEYISQNIQSLNNNPLTRLIKPDDHHLNHSHHNLKSDDQLSYTTTSGGNSTTPSVSSPPSSHPLGGHANSDFNSGNGLSNTHHQSQNGGLAAPTAQDPVTSQILHNLLEQQMLVQQQSQPQQQLIGNLMQAINKSQNPTDTNALVQMAMVAMQMNANQQQATQQTTLGQTPQNPLGNIVQQLLIAQSMGAAQNGFQLPAQQVPPYLNDSMFSVGSIRRVMDEEPQLFWSRMREVGVLDELLDSVTMAVDRIRALYSKRDSTSEEEEFAARRLSGMANLLDLGAVFGEKIRGRFVQSALISKELQMAIALQNKDTEQKIKLEAAKRRSQVFDTTPLLKAEPDMKKMRLM